ncbi:MAG: PEGA domain-containing protein [Burkholderiales bacterium]|nr:PEGA domain-containing protein [Burkholderiales bacterium]
MSNGNRTFICSVVFIDIAGYSKKSVAEQLQIKERLNALLAQALAGVPAKDRIILDTGDGAAISFLGDPEEALFLRIALRDTLRDDGTLQLRTGINLGPVRLVRDINGQPNIIGDGINVAQRIMSFAGINQVFVSRALLQWCRHCPPGLRPPVRLPGFAHRQARARAQVYARQARRLRAAAHAAAQARRAAAAPRRCGKMTHAACRARPGRRPPLATGLAVALILLAATGIRLVLQDVEARAQKQAELAKSTVIMPRPLPAAETPPAPVADAQPAPRPRPAKKAAAADEGAATGTLRLAVLPWGEIFINGNQYGISPPLRDVALKPGIYRIEVRNPGFASYLQVVEVKPDEEIRIRHRFH